VVKVGILDNEYYLEEKLYESELSSTLFVGRLDTLGLDKNASHYGDSNRPDYIDEVEKAGYIIKGAEKGAGSVIKGIDICKKCKLHIHSGSLNLLKEIRSYKFKEDRNGHVIDEPVKFNDHLMDAMRYALMEHLQGYEPVVYLV